MWDEIQINSKTVYNRRVDLIPIADALWQCATWIRLPGGAAFPARMTIVRLGDGRLWLHSPVAIDDDLAARLAVLGEVGYLVSPNRVHSMFAAAAKERYPSSELWACPTLPAKRRKIPFDAEIDPSVEPPWHADLDQLLVAGCPGMSEMVFLHRPTRTLIATDLLMNIQEVRGWRMRAVLWLADTREKFVQSKFWKPFIKDREAARESARRILAWEPQRVVMCHGDPVEGDLSSRLPDALRLLLP